MRLPLNAAWWCLGLGMTAVAGLAADGPTQDIGLRPGIEVRKEFFVQRSLGASADADPVILVAWKCRREGGLEVLEREVLFGAGDLRLLHTENLGLGMPRLVWRELGRRGRTWIAEWSPERKELITLEFSVAQDVHRLQGVQEVQFPLGLVEEMRLGITREGLIGRLSPTHAGIEQVRMSETKGCPADLPAWTKKTLDGRELRCVELRTPEGCLLARYVFGGDELLAFQWGSGTAWSVRVSKADWRRYERAWYVAQGRAAKAAAGARLGANT